MINPSPVLDDVTGYDSAIGIGTYDPNLNVAFDVDVSDPLVVNQIHLYYLQ